MLPVQLARSAKLTREWKPKWQARELLRRRRALQMGQKSTSDVMASYVRFAQGKVILLKETHRVKRGTLSRHRNARHNAFFSHYRIDHYDLNEPSASAGLDGI